MAEVAAIQQKLPDEVLDGLTWPQYCDLQAFWKRWPPLIISSAVIARMAPQQRETTETPGELNDDDVALLMSLSS